MEPPLSVRLETIADGVYAHCPELDIHASGSDEQSALEQLSAMICDYWSTLLQDVELRESSPQREHYALFVQKVIPFIYELEQVEAESGEPVGFRTHVAEMIRRVDNSDPARTETRH